MIQLMLHRKNKLGYHIEILQPGLPISTRYITLEELKAYLCMSNISIINHAMPFEQLKLLKRLARKELALKTE